MSQENSPTSSSPENSPSQIVCFDPQNAEAACPICGGRGVISYQVELDDPRFGKLYRCPNNPIEMDTERQDRLRKLSDLKAYADKSFHNFDACPPGYMPNECSSLNTAYEVAQRFAEQSDGWLLLEGTYGCGKTHLAAALGNARLERGEFVLFVTAPDLLDHLRGSYSPQADLEYDTTFDRVRNAEVLILDDLGVENPSAWAKEKLFQLLNYRYSRRMVTIITTNADFDSLDPRISSRMQDVDFIRRVRIHAPDYRASANRSSDDLFSRLSLYADMHFDNFDTAQKLLPDERRNLERIVQAAHSYAQQPQGWLVFMGTYGSGKTHLAAAIANLRRTIGEEVILATVPDLLDFLRVTFDPRVSTSFDKRFHTVRNAPFLVLDDIRLASATAWAKEKLFQILDYRYVSNLPTVLTTSKPIEDMDERLVSRILDQRRCTVFAITVPGYALRMKRQH